MTRWMNYTDGMFEEPEGPYVLWVDAEDEVQRLQEEIKLLIAPQSLREKSLRAERDALAKRVAERDKLIEELQRIHRDTLDAVLAPVPETPPEAQKGPLGIPIEASDSLAPDEVRFVDHTGVKARIVNLAEPPEAQGREEVER